MDKHPDLPSPRELAETLGHELSVDALYFLLVYLDDILDTDDPDETNESYAVQRVKQLANLLR
jgi:hypothetical protein